MYVESGVKQRVRALEAFLADVYGPQTAVRDGVIPATLISSSSHFHRQAAGIVGANGVRIHVAGIDVIRDEKGAWRVLEDNVRVPSGVSYVLANRRVMAQTLPELFTSLRVRPVVDYPGRPAPGSARGRTRGDRSSDRRRADARRVQLRVLRAHAAGADDGRRARRGPRPLLLRRAGVDAHDRRSDPRRRHLPPGGRRVPGSAALPAGLGARSPGADAGCAPRQRHSGECDRQRRRGRQARVHVRSRAHPLLPRRGSDPPERRHLAPGGAGCSRGGARSPGRARREAGRRLRREGARGRPRRLPCRAGRSACATARRSARLDRAAGRAALDDPDARRGRIPPRHVDLRPFAVNDGNDIWVLPGGLTRVALPEGQLVVNSSQGGGSKDTWVLDPSLFTGPTATLAGLSDPASDEVSIATGAIGIVSAPREEPHPPFLSSPQDEDLETRHHQQQQQQQQQGGATC